ncbi:MAG: tRNA dihydrouridine(20/20a) synthase DusA [Rhodobacteraceae bacterium]|nr:tRNA dihydrouridine(20/20a) synthase DusA [Paracoccaceae bacterium]
MTMKRDLAWHARLSVAPMMDWTDRHCRYLHRMLSRHTLLYTEMVTVSAILHGNAEQLLGFNPAEHPVALQIGGAVPEDLAKATAIGCDFGYDEVNLNVGCPSDRVQSGRFGACLMQDPGLLADCARAMTEQSAGRTQITMKCRIGVDDQVPEAVLPDLIEKVAAQGIERITIHARMAWLQGLSPRENRNIPPLDYPLVHAMKTRFPAVRIILNGGVQTLDEVLCHLGTGIDGVMLGRAAYHTPVATLGSADRRVFGDGQDCSADQAVLRMLPYIDAQLSKGVRLNRITRPMLGLFAGCPGARRWRQVLSQEGHKPGAGPEVLERALSAVLPAAA